MNSNISRIGRRLVTVLTFASLFPVPGMAGVSDLSNGPLATGSAVTVKPNIAFLMDDSGSMDWDNAPGDDSDNRNNRCFGNYRYNTVFYNPAVTYKPPFKIDGATYSDGVTRFPDASFTAALKDGYFPSGGYTFSGSATSNSAVDLSSVGNLTPSAVSCNAVASASATGSISHDGSFSAGGGNNRCYQATSVKVGTTELLNASTTTTNSTACNADSFGAAVAAQINAKTATTGYSASYSNSNDRITIAAPFAAGASPGAITFTFVKTSSSASGNETFNSAAFSGYKPTPECASSPSRYYYSTYVGSTLNSSCQGDSNYTIVTSASNIAAPGVAAGSAAAKTNYANWYSYYRFRAGLMKAATGEAFKDLDQSKYRIGLFFINSNEALGSTSKPNSDFKIADFTGSASGTQRYDWFTKLYANRDGGSTPLRVALSRVGRMYAGQFSGWDPVQYACQQNFTIASTDGYWNDPGEPLQIDGVTEIGDQDGGLRDASGATATLEVGDMNSSGSSDGCYKAGTVTVGGVTLTAADTSSCTTSQDSLGSRIAAAINGRTSTTGYSASYSNGADKVTISAPASAGESPGTPVYTPNKTSGSRSRSFPVTAFTGFVAARTTATARPYYDSSNAINTLADVAYYYYATDLRTAALNNCSNTIAASGYTGAGGSYTNLCENIVRTSGTDTNTQQHMTTFTIGLGVNGTITYESNYATAANVTGVTQYADIVNGSANWPNPHSNDPNKIDDLWHAAVNGRGTYFSAGDATTLQNGLESAIASIQSQKGSSAAAATSNLEPVAGDNYVYVALYQTQLWDGDLQAFTIDPDTGALSGTALWSARTNLDAQVSAAGAGNDGRTIKFFSSAATGKLKDFDVTNLTADGLHLNFKDICNKTPKIDQCGANTDDLDSVSSTFTTQIAAANSETNLIKYLRGQGTYEMESSISAVNRLYRSRDHVLGDIVNAVPVYMKKPPFSFDTYDTTYATFKTDNDARAPTVFVAANDGMLHAINADNDSANKGKERWAYVPTMVMPNMWHLADRAYGDDHHYYVDGSPTLADICSSLSAGNAQVCADANKWKTILVGGLNKGGCGYYALDVTDPAAPKGLWEFTNANLGYSYGNPIVGKRKDGKWVVIVTSGYNNYPNNGCGVTGDGNGHVFVLDANDGTLLDDIVTNYSDGTPAGTTGTPSGLAKLNAWIADSALPTINRLYGGDMLGNVWRIDFDNNYAPSGKEAVLLAQLKDGSSPTPKVQPITTKPELAETTSGGVSIPVVLVGTGRYLGESDLTDLSKQSVYGLKDALGTSGISNVRGTTMKQITLTKTDGTGTYAGRTVYTAAGDTVNWTNDEGWYLDLESGTDTAGSRVNVDMSLQVGILTVAANTPIATACTAGGFADVYFLDFATGKNVSTAVGGMAGVRLGGNALIAGIKTVKLTSGKTVTVITDTAGNVSSEANPGSAGSGGGPARRTTWREIQD